MSFGKTQRNDKRGSMEVTSSNHQRQGGQARPAVERIQIQDGPTAPISTTRPSWGHDLRLILVLVLFAAGRFGLEFFRARTVVFGGLSLAQWVCLEMGVGVLAVLFLSGHRAGSAALRESG